MFSHSFLIASYSVSSFENILPDNFHFIKLKMFSSEFKSVFPQARSSLVMSFQKATCYQFSWIRKRIFMLKNDVCLIYEDH